VPAPYDVVIVPGFGGTQLSYRGGFRGKTSYWYNPAVMGTSNPLAGALASDGVSPYPVLGKTLFADGPVNMGIYEPMITNLANNGHNPYFWAYDWRLGAVQLGGMFASALRSLSLTRTFSVVAHSYGGLVAQLAYPTYTATPPPVTWAKTVYLGTPHG
jgi:pimeloyl-ACP methyl ester carboxylesterase